MPDPPQIERLYFLASEAMTHGNWGRAIEALRQILGEDPGHPGAHRLLALCLLNQNRLHAAEHEAQLALQGDPQSASSALVLGQVRTAQRRFGDARELFEEALRLRPDLAEPHRQLALLDALQGQRQAAEDRLATARSLAPEDPEILTDLSDLALASGRHEEARRLAEQALALEPTHPEALVAMGQALLRTDDQSGAREHAVWVLRHDPNHRGALSLLASIKARESPLLGLWWRFATWMGELGGPRSIAVLLGAFVVYRLLTLTLEDFGHQEAAELVQLGWLGLCLYTWFAPGLFRRQLAQELSQVELDRDF